MLVSWPPPGLYSRLSQQAGVILRASQVFPTPTTPAQLINKVVSIGLVCLQVVSLALADSALVDLLAKIRSKAMPRDLCGRVMTSR